MTSGGGGYLPPRVTCKKKQSTTPVALRMSGWMMKSLNKYNKAFKHFQQWLAGCILDKQETIKAYLLGINLGILKLLLQKEHKPLKTVCHHLVLRVQSCYLWSEVNCYRPWEHQAAIDRCASCKSWLTGAMGTVFVLEQQDRLALQ